MPRTIRVLVLEDDEVWQNNYDHMLNLSGRCNSSTFDNVEEALAAMRSEVFHVAIVDLQLNKASSATRKRVDEFEGYQLVNAIVQSGWLRNMVVCVVSHWSDIAQLEPFKRRSSIEIDTARRSIASGVEVDNIFYFTKNEYSAEQLWQRIHDELIRKGIYTEHLPQQRDILEVLAHRMTRNMIEHIESSSEHSKLAPEDEWLRDFYYHHGESGLQIRLRMEISDLLMRWAQEVQADDIQLYQIGSGLSKATVVKATRMVNNIWELPVIIKMGYHREIRGEREAYKKLVRRFVLRVPPAENGSSTFLLAAQIYDFVHEGISFDDAYINLPIEDLENLIEDLAKNCGLWYQAKYQKKAYAQEYKDYLHCHLPRFKKPIETLQNCSEAGGQIFWEKERICFPDIDGDFANPLILLLPQSRLSSRALPAMRSFTHGDFNANNILIRQNHSWLIDFGRTEDSHAMRDFIQLEAVVKFVLLRGATLRERFELETALMQQNHFEEIEELRQSYQPTGLHAARLQRAFRLVCKIREQVWTTILNNETNIPVGDFEQYRMGLFFLTLNSVRFIRTASIPDGIEPLHALHALMSAAMLGESLRH